MARGNPPRVSEQRLHWAIIAVAAVLAVAMVGAAAWALTRPQAPGLLPVAVSPVEGETSQGANPATSSAGTVPTDTYAPPIPETPVSAPTTAPTNVGAPVQAAGRRIAFHIGNTLYLASEDGKSKTPMHIVGTDYALSPDGRTVAAVERGKLVVAAVGQHLLASSPSTPGLTAEATPPLWLPDSSAVLFIRTDQQGAARVWRLDLSRGTASEVGLGAGVAVSPDGRTLATLSSEDASAATISVTTGGKASRFRVPLGDPVAIALGKNRVFVSTVSASGSSAVWTFDYDGGRRKQIVGSGVAGSTAVTYGAMMLSPDGTKLLFSADGDDGYSRLWTVPVTGGTPKAISGLRDGYAVGWTRDGKGILFIEGNAFQGQATALWHSDLTGNRRRKLVDGATL